MLGGNSISRPHAQIVRRGAAYEIRDLSSLNGVYCDGVPVSAAPMREGCVLRLGDWVGLVVRADSAEALQLCKLSTGLFGSEALGKVVATAKRAARSPMPVLLLGETGTGKELLAQAIHEESQRSGEFIAVNCAALTESLVEAELFGHAVGAFTGADRVHKGFLRRADGGTLFLDEVGELPLPVQAKLLRAVEDNLVMPVGSDQQVRVDLRVVCATHRPLSEMIEEGSFRQDLYARLEGVVIELPALRERRADIVPLFQHFIAAAPARPKLNARFVERLLLLPFVRNVRELKQMAARLLLLHGEEAEWGSHHLPDLPVPEGAASAVESPAALRSDREGLLRCIEANGGNLARAARALGVSRQTLHSWLREHGVDLAALRARIAAAQPKLAK